MNVNAYWLDEKSTILGCNQFYCNYLNIESSTVLLNKSMSQIEAEYDLQFKISNKRDTPVGLSFVKCYTNKSHERYFNVSQCTLFGFTLIIETNISEYIDTISRLNEEITKLQNREVQTNAYLNNVIRIVPASIYWKDLDLVIRGSNLFHTKLAGFSDPKEVIGKTEYDFVWKDQAAEIMVHDQQIISEGKGTRLEEKATLADGSVHTFLTSKEPLRDSNSQVIGIIGISIDISEQKESENRAHKAEAMALIAKSKADSEIETRKTVMILVGDIVHDLRTPIATLRSIGVLLSNLFPDIIAILDEAKELGSEKIKSLSGRKMNALHDNTIVSSIQNSVQMMDEFINLTLKELSNAQKGLQEELEWNELTRCSSRRILENTLDAYPFDSFITVHNNTSYDFYLMGNSILVMKILFNLIRNAVDQITINGKGEIFIETSEHQEVNQIKIKDTAGGAPPESIDKLFEGYFTTKTGGTGIGLASCKRIMETFGGTLSVDNKYGYYIEFIMSFPKISE